MDRTGELFSLCERERGSVHAGEAQADLGGPLRCRGRLAKPATGMMLRLWWRDRHHIGEVADGQLRGLRRRIDDGGHHADPDGLVQSVLIVTGNACWMPLSAPWSRADDPDPLRPRTRREADRPRVSAITLVARRRARAADCVASSASSRSAYRRPPASMDLAGHAEPGADDAHRVQVVAAELVRVALLPGGDPPGHRTLGVRRRAEAGQLGRSQPRGGRGLAEQVAGERLRRAPAARRGHHDRTRGIGGLGGDLAGSARNRCRTANSVLFARVPQLGSPALSTPVRVLSRQQHVHRQAREPERSDRVCRAGRRCRRPAASGCCSARPCRRARLRRGW